ncbi:MAG: glycerol kinase, partial [Crocosphaera sp.]
VLDATAQGAAFGAGLSVGFWDDYDPLIASRKIDRIFEPGDKATAVQENFIPWTRAVGRSKNWVYNS